MDRPGARICPPEPESGPLSNDHERDVVCFRFFQFSFGQIVFIHHRRKFRGQFLRRVIDPNLFLEDEMAAEICARCR